MRPKERALDEDRLEPEGVAEPAVERLLEIGRRDKTRGRQALAQIRDVAALVEHRDHLSNEFRSGHRPVDPTRVMWHGNECVGGLMSRGRHRRIGKRRDVEILREVGCEHVAIENICQEACIARSEDDVMVP